MLKIAITGNIASGKSTVENFIRKLGYNVYDTDKIAHKILENSNDVKNLFGTADRKKIGKIVFDDNKKLKELESIIHPLVKKEIANIFAKSEDAVFIAVPQLFEAGFDSMFDKIIFISADTNIRLERLILRNNISKEEALKRIKAQDNESKKIQNSDFIIVNNNDIESLKIQVQNIIEQLILIR